MNRYSRSSVVNARGWRNSVLDHRHDAAANQEGHRRDRLERCGRRGAVQLRIFRAVGSRRLDHHRCATADRVRCGRLPAEQVRFARFSLFRPIADGPRNLRRPSVFAEQHHQRGVGLERVQRLLHRRLDDGRRAPCVRQRGGDLCDAIRLSGGALGGEVPVAIALEPSRGTFGDDAVGQPARAERDEHERVGGRLEIQQPARHDDEEVDRERGEEQRQQARDRARPARRSAQSRCRTRTARTARRGYVRRSARSTWRTRRQGRRTRSGRRDRGHGHVEGRTAQGLRAIRRNG